MKTVISPNREIFKNFYFPFPNPISIVQFKLSFKPPPKKNLTSPFPKQLLVSPINLK